MGYDPRHGRVLENGFQTERFAPSNDKREHFRARYGLQASDFVIGNVGRFDVAKGHVYLLEAFGEVLKRVPNAHLVLLGRGIDRSNDFINTKIRQMGLGSRVQLLGEQESIQDIYPGFDLYCSPSLNEGFPNALSEAMSSGLPCVATDTGASRQLVEGLGLVVRSKRPEELADAILSIANKSSEERFNIGHLSRQRIVTKFGLERIVDEYCQVYRGVCGADR
jgi:glycosyltransferase involved in cell wall biosynthesis